MLQRFAANHNRAITITEVASGTGDVQGVSAATGLRLMGYTVKENAGSPAAAEVILRHGTSTSDTPVAFIKLAASASSMQMFGDEGIPCANGVFVDRVSGTTHITLFTKIFT